MGMDYESKICFGSNKENKYLKLPKEIRAELDDDGDVCAFDFKDFGINDCDFKNFYIKKYTDNNGDFIGFGIEISKHHFEDDKSSIEIDIDSLKSKTKALKIACVFRHFKIGEPIIFHFINIW